MIIRNSAARKRRFTGCVQTLNQSANAVREFNDALIDPKEAWDAFKGLLGHAGDVEMTEGIRNVYGNHGTQYELQQSDGTPVSRSIILRRHARSVMHTIRRHMPPLVPHAEPDPPPVIVPIAPVVAVPIVAAAAAQPIHVFDNPLRIRRMAELEAQIRAIETRFRETNTRLHADFLARTQPFEVFRAEIEKKGKLDSALPEDMPPAQIEQLFSLLREWGECPICLDNVPKRFSWTYLCDHRACPTCMENMVVNSLMSSMFPIMCPGGCGNPIDPRKLLDACALTRPNVGALVAKDSVVRFVSLQLGSTVVVSPSTAHEVHTCPNCRTVVFGRPDSIVPMARCTNPFCAYRFCVNCKTPWHDNGAVCEDKAKSDEASSANIRDTTKACPMCGRRTEHFREHRCHHMTCLCKHEYCYECLDAWSEHAVGKSREHCMLYCSANCHCVPCDECKPGKRCNLCHNGCSVCKI